MQTRFKGRTNGKKLGGIRSCRRAAKVGQKRKRQTEPKGPTSSQVHVSPTTHCSAPTTSTTATTISLPHRTGCWEGRRTKKPRYGSRSVQRQRERELRDMNKRGSVRNQSSIFLLIGWILFVFYCQRRIQLSKRGFLSYISRFCANFRKGANRDCRSSCPICFLTPITHIVVKCSGTSRGGR